MSNNNFFGKAYQNNKFERFYTAYWDSQLEGILEHIVISNVEELLNHPWVRNRKIITMDELREKVEKEKQVNLIINGDE